MLQISMWWAEKVKDWEKRWASRVASWWPWCSLSCETVHLNEWLTEITGHIWTEIYLQNWCLVFCTYYLQQRLCLMLLLRVSYWRKWKMNIYIFLDRFTFITQMSLILSLHHLLQARRAACVPKSSSWILSVYPQGQSPASSPYQQL